MLTLAEYLAALPHRDLRGVVTRLGLRQRDQHRKEVWIAAVTQAWFNATERARLLALLSPTARAVAARLAQAGELPAALFWAEYGPIRRPGPQRAWTPPPWARPQCVSEELYYAGLLAPAAPGHIETAARLTLPADLAAFFPPPSFHPSSFIPSLLSGQALPPSQTPAARLLHDLGQVASYLVSQPGLTLQHGRWLAPAHLEPLNRRLLQPDPTALLGRHTAAPRLRWLFFLAAAAGLQAQGRLTPLGYAWLAEPPSERLTCLWHAWRAAAPALRQAYRQPAADLPAPWPDLLLTVLAQQTGPFTAGQLATTLLGQTPTYNAYFTAHLADHTTLAERINALLAAPLTDFGVIARRPADRMPEPRDVLFELTPTGVWLLTPAQTPWPAPPLADVSAAAAARLASATGDVWQIAIAACTAPVYHAGLAPYAVHVELRAAADPPQHLYQLTAATVATAAAAGYGLPSLLAILADLGLGLSPAAACVVNCTLPHNTNCSTSRTGARANTF